MAKAKSVKFEELMFDAQINLQNAAKLAQTLKLKKSIVKRIRSLGKQTATVITNIMDDQK
jgi:hypothetical protein